jgi:hypothetical protein
LDGGANALAGLSDNGEAKPAPWAGSCGTAPEPLEQVLTVWLRDPGAMIDDAESSIASERDGDL